jgi:hypothetical protein
MEVAVAWQTVSIHGAATCRMSARCFLRDSDRQEFCVFLSANRVVAIHRPVQDLRATHLKEQLFIREC